MSNIVNNKIANSRSNTAISTKKNSSGKVVKKIKKNNDTGRIAFLLFVVGLFIVILISTVFSDVMQIVNNRRDTKELSVRKQELLEEEKSLKSEVSKLQDPAYIDRYAREKYLLTSEGEKILIFVDGDATRKDADNSSVSLGEE